MISWRQKVLFWFPSVAAFSLFTLHEIWGTLRQLRLELIYTLATLGIVLVKAIPAVVVELSRYLIVCLEMMIWLAIMMFNVSSFTALPFLRASLLSVLFNQAPTTLLSKCFAITTTLTRIFPHYLRDVWVYKRIAFQEVYKPFPWCPEISFRKCTLSTTQQKYLV